MSLFLRHLLWTTLCPGTVTILIPYFFLSHHQIPGIQFELKQIGGLLLIVAGTTILLTCIYLFARIGKGTLSPFDPARNLVIKGFYRYVRNPMYVGVIIMLVGETIYMQSLAFLFYTCIVFVLFNLFIIYYEEPYLRKEFGEQYDQYRMHVGRWIPGKPYTN